MAASYTWFVQLVGHPFDLEDLPYWLADGEPTVLREDDAWFLVARAFERMTDANDVRRAAEEYLPLLNGLGRLQDQSFRTIDLGDMHRRGSDGRRTATVVLLSGVECRSKAGRLTVVRDGVEIPDPTKGSLNPLLQSALRSEKVQRVLMLVGRSSLTWNDLYRALEVIESDAGHSLLAQAAISEAQLSCFTHTAGSYSAIGVAARHGVDKTVPPKDPMPFHEAREMILRLIKIWLLR